MTNDSTISSTSLVLWLPSAMVLTILLPILWQRKRDQQRFVETQQRLEAQLQTQLRLNETLQRQNETQQRQSETQQRQNETQQRLIEGTYYASIDEVWGDVESVPFNKFSYFENLQRIVPPDFIARSAGNTNTCSIYRVTISCAINPNTVATDNETSSRTSHSSSKNERDQIWPHDIFGGPIKGAHIAHLVPASSNHAAQYFDVARWALGFYNADVGWATIQKAIHGAKDVKKSKREKYTGIKHFASNKIRLCQQAEVLDRDPCLLIIPVMDLSQVRSWNGEGYHALVLPGKYQETSAADVCLTIRMIKLGPVAQADDIEKARELLEKVLCGLAYSRINHFSRAEFTDSQQREVDNLPSPSAFDGGVIVPREKPISSSLHVRLVQFSDHKSSNGHPAPDPLFLAVRAAVAWSWRHDQKLLAGGELHEEEEDELDALANEQYLAWRAQLHRPKTFQDLARGLHQENGYDEAQVRSVTLFEEKDEWSDFDSSLEALSVDGHTML